MLLIVVNSDRSGRKSKSLGIATWWLVNPIRKLRPRLGGGSKRQSELSGLVQTQSPSKRSRHTAVQRNPSSATFHGWKDVDLIVKTSVVVEEDDDDLNEGFCHYSIMDDE